jgi:hypothetical protein
MQLQLTPLIFAFLAREQLNSSDYVQGSLTEDDALLNVKWLAEGGNADFVEISGGNYENPCKYLISVVFARRCTSANIPLSFYILLDRHANSLRHGKL